MNKLLPSILHPILGEGKDYHEADVIRSNLLTIESLKQYAELDEYLLEIICKLIHADKFQVVLPFIRNKRWQSKSRCAVCCRLSPDTLSPDTKPDTGFKFCPHHCCDICLSGMYHRISDGIPPIKFRIWGISEGKIPLRNRIHCPICAIDITFRIGILYDMWSKNQAYYRLIRNCELREMIRVEKKDIRRAENYNKLIVREAILPPQQIPVMWEIHNGFVGRAMERVELYQLEIDANLALNSLEVDG